MGSSELQRLVVFCLSHDRAVHLYSTSARTRHQPRVHPKSSARHCVHVRTSWATDHGRCKLQKSPCGAPMPPGAGGRLARRICGLKTCRTTCAAAEQKAGIASTNDQNRLTAISVMTRGGEASGHVGWRQYPTTIHSSTQHLFLVLNSNNAPRSSNPVEVGPGSCQAS